MKGFSYLVTYLVLMGKYDRINSLLHWYQILLLHPLCKWCCSGSLYPQESEGHISHCNQIQWGKKTVSSPFATCVLLQRGKCTTQIMFLRSCAHRGGGRKWKRLIGKSQTNTMTRKVLMGTSRFRGSGVQPWARFLSFIPSHSSFLLRETAFSPHSSRAKWTATYLLWTHE